MRNNIRSQAGMTGFAWLLVIALIAFFATALLTLYPMYFNHYKAVSQIKSVTADSATATMTKSEIRKAIGKRFQVDNVEFINLTDDLTIKVKKKKMTITLSYEVRAHLLGNIFVVGDFSDNVFEVQGR